MVPSAGHMTYGDFLESALARIESLLKGEYRLSRRAIALFLLQGDAEVEELVKRQEGSAFAAINSVVAEARARFSVPVHQLIAQRRQQEARRIVDVAASSAVVGRRSFAEILSRAMMHPLTGIPIVMLTLYGLYQFVGVLGAGVAVGFIEKTLFGQWINPWFTGIITRFIPWDALSSLFVGDYGIITLGVTYAVAIVLPIVGFFFIAFSIIEDSGYLPRLAMLVDRLFKFLGLSGRAVIPMVLGFGCVTMATIVTRTQETRRERVLTTLLLALAIPCSAQLGVILAILSGSSMALALWAGVVAGVFLLVGFLAARVIPGRKASFYMEIPPLRLPKVSNVVMKTLARMRWYFGEVFPIFILASLILWLGDLTGLFDLAVRGMAPLVGAIGLPREAAAVFLYGFFRRDFGAAGLYNLHNAGVLSGVSLLVAAVTLTLFVPCVAQFGVMLKERGRKVALGIAAFIFPFAFLVGYVLNLVLISLGVRL